MELLVSVIIGLSLRGAIGPGDSNADNAIAFLNRPLALDVPDEPVGCSGHVLKTFEREWICDRNRQDLTIQVG